MRIYSREIILDNRAARLQSQPQSIQPMATLPPLYDGSTDTPVIRKAKDSHPPKASSVNIAHQWFEDRPKDAEFKAAVMAGLKVASSHDAPMAASPQSIASMVKSKAVVKPEISGSSLKSFIAEGGDFERSDWTPERIADALISESWRARDIGETVKESDIIAMASASTPMFDRVQGWKDIVISPEHCEIHGCTVYTLESGGKKRKKPLFDKTTADFPDGILSVPKGVQLKLPTDEKEAARFFGCDVVVTEVFDKMKPVKAFYPVPTKMADRAFRQAFSRIFIEFAKKHFRDHIKGLIYGRGDGIRLKRGIKVRKILRLVQDMCRDGRDINIREVLDIVGAKFNIHGSQVASLLSKHSYGQAVDGEPIISFAQRMNERNLTPVAFKYDKGLGIEIEAVCPMTAKDAQARVPSYVRTTYDGSLRNDKGEKMSANGGNSQADLAAGLHGLWGVEFQALVKRSEMETRILKMIEAIGRLGCKVNKSCGLHIHLDMRDKDLREVEILHQRLTTWLGVLRDLLPTSRRNNQYCNFENPDTAHHAAVSLDAYKRHKTLEVRVHSSTLNHIKIIQWIRLIETVAETKFLPLPKTTTLDGLKMLNLTEADRTYWLKRHQQLNPKLYKGGALDLGFLGDNPHEDE